MIEDGAVWECSDNRLKMQGSTNRDLFHLIASMLEELLKLNKAFIVCPGAFADQNEVIDLQDIAAIESAGVLNGVHRAVEFTLDIFS